MMDANLEHVGVHGGDDVVKEVGLTGEQLLGRVPHHLFGLLRVLGADAVPIEGKVHSELQGIIVHCLAFLLPDPVRFKVFLKIFRGNFDFGKFSRA